MVIVLTVIHVMMCFLIVGIVLLQAGKGADIGSAFGGGGSQAVFGSMGTPTILGKITAAVAIVFMVTSFALAMIGGERSTSVIKEPPKPVPAPAPATPATPAPPAPTPAPGTPASKSPSG